MFNAYDYVLSSSTEFEVRINLDGFSTRYVNAIFIM